MGSRNITNVKQIVQVQSVIHPILFIYYLEVTFTLAVWYFNTNEQTMLSNKEKWVKEDVRSDSVPLCECGQFIYKDPLLQMIWN